MTSDTTIPPEAVKQSSLLRRIVNRVTVLTTTTIIVAGAGGVVWLGSSMIAERAAAVASPPATDPIYVKTMPIDVQTGYTISRAFVGQIEPPQTATLSFEQGGTLNSVLVQEGDTVRAGEVIATLDDRLIKAERDQLRASKEALQAQRELQSLNNERANQLNKRGFASTQTLDQNRLGLVELNARMAEIDAGLLSVDVRLEKLTIAAPFAGQVSIRHVDPGTTVGNGQAVVTLVDDALPIFRVGVEPDLADTLSAGKTVDVRFGNKVVAAEIVGTLPTLDPITRTRTIRARLRDETQLSYGLTGEMQIEQVVEANGAWLPLTAIEDGVRGLWTIKTVAEDETVAIEAVEMLHAEERRAFVRGTFSAETRVISDGLHRVVAGQPVRLEPTQ